MIEVKLSEICSCLGARFSGEDKIIKGVSTDSRTVREDELFIALVGDKFDAHDFVGGINCAAAVCEKEVGKTSFPVIRVVSTLAALGMIAKHNAEKAGLLKTVSLTGSVGKTTTKEFTSLVFSSKYKTRKTEGNLNNHIGVPKTLLTLDESDEVLVCEMGMSARGEISYLSSLVTSDIAIITNIGHSHIENLKTRENIALAKLEIVESLKCDGTLIVNGDEPLLENTGFSGNVVKVGFSPLCQVRAARVCTYSDRVEFDAWIFDTFKKVTLPCAGRHNVYNALSALAAGYVAGIDMDLAVLALSSYTPVGMRQNTYEKDGVVVIADCYNAGIESMCAALEALVDIKGDRRSVAVLGDMLELGDSSEELHRMVGKKAAECKIDTVIAFGKDARFIALEAEKNGVRDVRFFENKKEASEAVLEVKKEKSAVLFKASRSMKCEEIIALAGLSQN